MELESEIIGTHRTRLPVSNADDLIDGQRGNIDIYHNRRQPDIDQCRNYTFDNPGSGSQADHRGGTGAERHTAHIHRGSCQRSTDRAGVQHQPTGVITRVNSGDNKFRTRTEHSQASGPNSQPGRRIDRVRLDTRQMLERAGRYPDCGLVSHHPETRRTPAEFPIGRHDHNLMTAVHDRTRQGTQPRSADAVIIRDKNSHDIGSDPTPVDSLTAYP
nr:hypothetical protein [Nocardia vaccinii]